MVKRIRSNRARMDSAFLDEFSVQERSQRTFFWWNQPIFVSWCQILRPGKKLKLAAESNPMWVPRRTKMSRMAKLFLLATIACCSILVFATAQQGDVLRLNGKKYFIYTNPLKLYLQENPGKLPKSEVISTGLWRGYIATWEVKD